MIALVPEDNYTGPAGDEMRYRHCHARESATWGTPCPHHISHAFVTRRPGQSSVDAEKLLDDTTRAISLAERKRVL